MNSDSGGERDSEEYNNPTERQDEQAARHQDEGEDEVFFSTGFLKILLMFYIDASGDKDTSHTEVGGESKRCLDDFIKLCRVMQLFQLMYYSIYSICIFCLNIFFMRVF